MLRSTPDSGSKSALGAVLVMLVALFLMSCADSGGGNSQPAPPEAEEISTENARLTQKTSFSEDDIHHFLTRTHFGIRQEDVDQIQEMGMSAYLDQRLNFHLLAPVEYAALGQIIAPSHPDWDELSKWWLYIMARTENPLQESVALFWHDHFAVSQDNLDAQSRYYMHNYLRLLREHGAGNFRTLLFDVAVQPAMLEFLDGVRSTKRAPNENFARELWELYTLGVDNGYTQDDIVEAARAFTGFRSRTNVPANQRFVEFDPERHDSGDKNVFGRIVIGREGPAGVDEFKDVIRITLDERPAAEFICEKIYEWFVHADPAQSMIDDMAAQLRADDYELAPLFKALFMSEAFYSAQAKDDGITKSPIDLAIGFIRTTELEYEMSTLAWRMSLAGQRPVSPPSVNGWPTGRLWLSADSMVQRANALQSAIVYRDYQQVNGLNVDRVLPPEGQRAAINVVNRIAELMRIDLTSQEITDCVNYLNTRRAYDGTESADPFDAENAEYIDERVRGLLWVLGQHPSYQVR